MLGKLLVPVGAAAILAVSCATGGASADSAWPDREIAGRTAAVAFPASIQADLARAACAGDAEGVRRLIAAGADPNARGLDDVTPLIWTLACENVDGVAALLESGADPKLYIRSPGFVFDPVHHAARMENVAYLKLLLKHGADPNSLAGGRRDEDRTPIFAALNAGITEAGWDKYYLLLESGADFKSVYGGSTLAESAAAFARWDKVLELIERGYDTRLEELGETLAYQRAEEAETPRLPEQRPWRERVAAALEARGVRIGHFPQDYRGDMCVPGAINPWRCPANIGKTTLGG